MKLKKTVTFVFAVFLCSFFLFVYEVQADNRSQGVLKSGNLLLGSTVESIDSMDVTATVLASTSVSISFSQNRVDFYSSDGTEGGWDGCSDGTTNVDLSGLGWTDSVLYYKVKLETEDNSITPRVQQIQLNFTGVAESNPIKANARREGYYQSKNVLSGASVQSINGVDVIASVPGGTSAEIQFSNDGQSWYNSSGEEWGWNECQNGTTNIDLSGLGWSDPSLYYRIKLATIDVAMRSGVSQVTIDFDGTTDGGPLPNEAGYRAEGYFLSDDLLHRRELIFEQPAQFAYEISYSPSAGLVKVQFSRDGENWYNSSGELLGWDTLPTGSYLDRGSALSLESLDWEGAEDFYYKLRLQADTDGRQSPIVSKAGLFMAGKMRLGSSVAYTLQDGLVGHWTFDGQDMEWGNTSAEVRDRSGNGNHGSLEGGLGQHSVARGQMGQALKFDGVGYVEATLSQATTTVSVWFDSGSSWEYLVKVDGVYYVNANASALDTFPIHFSGETVQIGRDEGGDLVSGKIDDVRIYNRALSESEIQELYEYGKRRMIINE